MLQCVSINVQLSFAGERVLCLVSKPTSGGDVERFFSRCGIVSKRQLKLDNNSPPPSVHGSMVILRGASSCDTSGQHKEKMRATCPQVLFPEGCVHHRNFPAIFRHSPPPQFFAIGLDPLWTPPSCPAALGLPLTSAPVRSGGCR